MPQTAPNSKKKYQEYLKSPEWKIIRKAARDRDEGKCEFCNGPPDHVHHVRYPKSKEADHIDNLVVACSLCHDMTHGIKSLEKQTRSGIIKDNLEKLELLTNLDDDDARQTLQSVLTYLYFIIDLEFPNESALRYLWDRFLIDRESFPSIQEYQEPDYDYSGESE